jgi:hypothetical protein
MRVARGMIELCLQKKPEIAANLRQKFNKENSNENSLSGKKNPGW